MRRFVIGLVMGLLFAGAWAYAQSATPTPDVCAPQSPTYQYQLQLPSLQCRAKVIGPTTGRCTIYIVQNVPVLDCQGAALQKFSLAAWP